MSNRAAGTLVLAETTGRVLLLRRADGQGWDQPGGMLESDEDAAAAAIRELDEETGFSAALLECHDSFIIRRLADGRYVGYMPRPPALAPLEYTVFVCTFREEFRPKISDEHTEWGWFAVGAPPLDIHPGTALALDVLRQKGS